VLLLLEVFSASLDALPAILALESQPRRAVVFVSVAERCCDCCHLRHMKVQLEEAP